VLFGLVEFGMLSRTDFVVHSFASSFGEEAAAVRNVPSMKIRKGGNIGGIDLENTEAECGNNQLLNLRRNKRCLLLMELVFTFFSLIVDFQNVLPPNRFQIVRLSCKAR